MTSEDSDRRRCARGHDSALRIRLVWEPHDHPNEACLPHYLTAGRTTATTRRTKRPCRRPGGIRTPLVTLWVTTPSMQAACPLFVTLRDQSIGWEESLRPQFSGLPRASVWARQRHKPPWASGSCGEVLLPAHSQCPRPRVSTLRINAGLSTDTLDLQPHPSKHVIPFDHDCAQFYENQSLLPAEYSVRPIR
jgi:hypothetical protein